MLTLHPNSLRASPLDPVANAVGGGSPPGSSLSADPAGFASLLRQTQMAPPPVLAPAPAPTPAATASPPPSEPEARTEPVSSQESPDETPASPESQTTQRARLLLKGKLHAADGSAVAARDARPTASADKAALATEPGAGPEKADKTDAADCRAPETQLASGTSPVDPNVMRWLAGLQRAATSQAAAPATTPDGKTAPAGTGTGTGTDTDTDTDTSVIEARGAAKGLLAADPKADAARARAATAEAVAASPFAAALVEQAGIVDKPQYKVIDDIKNLAAAGAGAVAPTPARGTDVPPPVAVAIAAPVSAPDFAQELGLRLSTLARDGVQTAELHLNPADMGPVSVQIVMDGSQARVDFGADMAATRQAIEAGLPALASALADAGFTLAGGGVSQHAGGRSDGHGSGASNGDGPRRSVGEDQVKQIASAAHRIVRQGGIDLFA